MSEIVGYLKGKSSLIIFDRHANLNANMEIECFDVKDMTLIPVLKVLPAQLVLAVV